MRTRFWRDATALLAVDQQPSDRVALASAWDQADYEEAMGNRRKELIPAGVVMTPFANEAYSWFQANSFRFRRVWVAHPIKSPMDSFALEQQLKAVGFAVERRRASPTVEILSYTSSRPPTPELMQVTTRKKPATLRALTKLAAIPTALRMLPGVSKILIASEKTGALRWLDARHPGSSGTFGKIEVDSSGELGLLSLALHPDFARNSKLYVSFTRRGRDGLELQVQEWKLQRDGAGHPIALRQPLPIFSARIWRTSRPGGKIGFNALGQLLLATGDFGLPEAVKPSWTPMGKVFAIDTDTRKYVILATGFQSPGQPAFRPGADHEFWLTDAGTESWQEVSSILPWHDYGWPDREGVQCAGPSPSCFAIHHQDPFIYYGPNEGKCIVGTVFVDPDHLAFADCDSGRAWTLDLRNRATEQFGQWPIHPSALAVDSEGGLYVADSVSQKVFAVEGRTEIPRK